MCRKTKLNVLSLQTFAFRSVCLILAILKTTTKLSLSPPTEPFTIVTELLGKSTYDTKNFFTSKKFVREVTFLFKDKSN